jgi:predicted membrane protein
MRTRRLMWNGVFWGSVLILVGFTFIFEALFHVDINIFRFLIAIVFIYIGIQIFIGSRRMAHNREFANENSCVFCESEFQFKENSKFQDYNVAFGSSKLNLSDIDLTNNSYNIEMNCAFGDMKVLINTEKPVKILAESAFGEIRFPDGTFVSFGNQIYETPAYSKTEGNKIEIHASVVFGALKFNPIVK